MWILKDNNFNNKVRASREAMYTLSNGYFGVRGFFEEEQSGILSLGGIYMAGIFGAGNVNAWNGKNRELVNMPNFLSVKIMCDGEIVKQTDYSDYSRSLDIEHGILNRTYKWKNKLKLEFERFVSASDIHIICQKITLTPLSDCRIEIDDTINTDTSNLNKVSCEPLPIQPGDKHYTVLNKTSDMLVIKTDGITPEEIHVKQKTAFKDNAFTRLVQVYTSRDDKSFEDFADYETYKKRHCNEWLKRWKTVDITIESAPDDQLALRYNMFHLMQVCPNNDSRISIGARGLTGEMYEGCVFWDTEIFKLPFFIFENPNAAKQLLKFRYNMLPAAKEHAKDLWFEGAMYPWQSCNLGYEQTEKNVGAFFAIHIVCDIAYALMQYYRATDDIDFMAKYGAEILIETSRFWKSRVTKRDDGSYDLLAVRGPNEYDYYVNNNSYTNIMARENLKNAIYIVNYLKTNKSDDYKKLIETSGLNENELVTWADIADNITICYDTAKKLYEEDSTYTKRVPLDLKKAKPTDKRIIDSTIPYEALPLYQVTKQADVVCLMNNLPRLFTTEEKQAAWDYYEPRTAHDSSLSYCSYAILAARLGMDDIAYKYFRTCAYLDIEDLKLNGISGLHFANFGGTWQAVVYGFAGVSIDDNTLILEPNMPVKWGNVRFCMHFKGNIIEINAKGKNASAKILSEGKTKIFVKIGEVIQNG